MRDRRDQLRIAPDERAILDDRRVLEGAVVVAGDRPRTNIHLCPDGRVTQIREMIRFRPRTQRGLLELNEIADLRGGLDSGLWSQMREGAQLRTGAPHTNP